MRRPLQSGVPLPVSVEPKAPWVSWPMARPHMLGLPGPRRASSGTSRRHRCDDGIQLQLASSQLRSFSSIAAIRASTARRSARAQAGPPPRSTSTIYHIGTCDVIHRRPRGALIKIILRTRQGHQREGVSGGGGQRRRTARAQRSQTGSAGSAKRARHAMRRRRSLRAKRDGSWRQQAGRARVRRAAHRESQPPRSDRWAGRCQGAKLRELPFAV